MAKPAATFADGSKVFAHALVLPPIRLEKVAIMFTVAPNISLTLSRLMVPLCLLALDCPVGGLGAEPVLVDQS